MNIWAVIFAGLRFCCVGRAVLGCLGMAALPLVAQPTFDASVASSEVTLGSRFEVSFALKNGEGTNFRPPVFSNFRVVGGPNLSSGMTIVNGNYYVHRTWSYELEARSTGQFKIGAAKVTVNGRSLNSNALSIRVKGNSSGKVPAGTNPELFVTSELSTEEAWTGQQLTYRVMLYTLLTLEGFDIIEMPDFQGFYAKEKIRFDTRVQFQNLHGKKYAVKILHEEALFPQEAGVQTIGIVRVRVGVERSGPLAMLGPLPMVLQTQPIQLRVKTLPEPVPANFSSGVGRYDWEWKADKDSCSTDDALVLTMRLRGDGDPKRATPPVLTLPAGLEGFEPKVLEEEEYENGQAIVYRKILEYTILAKEPGAYLVRPEMVFFDPDSSRYVTLQADSMLRFQVTIGKNYYANQLANDTLPLSVTSDSNLAGWKEQALDWLVTPWVWGVFAALLGLLLIFSWAKRRHKSTFVPASVPVRDHREQLKQAHQALGSSDPRVFYDVLLRTLQDFLTSRLGLAPAQLNLVNVRHHLTERQVPESRIQTLLQVWQTCEQVLFAGQTQTANPQTTWQAAEQVVQELERDLQK